MIKRWWLLIIMAAILSIVVLLILNQNTPLLRTSTNRYKLEVADTENLRIQGLSGRKSMPQDTCMLFDFATSDTHGIWMKDMNFLLDIVWISSLKVVVHVERDVSPNSYPKVYKPVKPANYVLECNTGFIQKEAIQVGDTLSF